MGCSAPTNAAGGRRFRAADTAAQSVKRGHAHTSAMELAPLRHVMTPVRLAALSLLPWPPRAGRTIVQVTPSKPVTRPPAAKPSPTKPSSSERQSEGTPVPESKGELPPVIRRTEVVAFALVALLIIGVITGLYLGRAFFLPITHGLHRRHHAVAGRQLPGALSNSARCRSRPDCVGGRRRRCLHDRPDPPRLSWNGAANSRNWVRC